MKMQSTTLFSQLNKSTLKNLTLEIKETLAIGYDKKITKIFSAAELWNIQRQRKSMNQRRRFAY